MATLVRVEQQDLRDLRVTRWLKLLLTEPRATSPYNPYDPRWAWLSTNLAYMTWGEWSIDSSSRNFQPNEEDRLGTPVGSFLRGYRYEAATQDLQFVERWPQGDGTERIMVAAVLYAVGFGRGYFRPNSGTPQPDGTIVGRGFSTFQTNWIRRGSFTWTGERA
jgi:hypothetical protein